MPPDYPALVPVTSPSGEIDLFIGRLDDSACIVYGTATKVDASCRSMRDAAFRSVAVALPKYERPLVRAALIPDPFLAAAAGHEDLGTVESNLLIVDDAVPSDRYVLVGESGAELLLVIPPPWDDPVAASTSLPQP